MTIEISTATRASRKISPAQMKPRHAAALALVGWYLMFPRPFPDNPLPQWNAPINQWDRYGDFASEAESEAKKARMIKLVEDPKTCADILQGKDSDWCARIEEYTDISQCVASDDSRFEGEVPPRVDHCCGNKVGP